MVFARPARGASTTSRVRRVSEIPEEGSSVDTIKEALPAAYGEFVPCVCPPDTLLNILQTDSDSSKIERCREGRAYSPRARLAFNE